MVLKFINYIPIDPGLKPGAGINGIEESQANTLSKKLLRITDRNAISEKYDFVVHL